MYKAHVLCPVCDKEIDVVIDLKFWSPGKMMQVTCECGVVHALEVSLIISAHYYQVLNDDDELQWCMTLHGRYSEGRKFNKLFRSAWPGGEVKVSNG